MLRGEGLVRPNAAWLPTGWDLAFFTDSISVSFPFVGIDCPGRAIMEAGWPIKPKNMIDSRRCVETVLNHLHDGPVAKISKVADIPLEDLESSTGLVSGFPCTPFSSAGQKRGLADKNCQLMYILNVMKTLAGRSGEPLMWAVLENVALLLKDKDEPNSPWQKLAKFMLEEMPEFTPWVIWECNSINYGTPQDRHRIYLVTFRRMFATVCGGVPAHPPKTAPSRKIGDFLLPYNGPGREPGPDTQLMKNIADFRRRFRTEIPSVRDGGPEYAVFNASRRLKNNGWNHVTFNYCPTLTTQNTYLYLMANTDTGFDKVPPQGRFLYVDERAMIVGVVPASLRSNNEAENIVSLGNGMSVNVVGAVLNQVLKKWVQWENNVRHSILNPNLLVTWEQRKLHRKRASRMRRPAASAARR